MATQFFFRNDQADIDPTTFGEDHALRLTNGTSSTTSVTVSQNGPLGAPIQATVGTLNNRPYFFWTKQLTGFTLSGNITFSLNARENNAACNATIQVSLYRTDYAGNIISTIITSNNGLEMITGITGVTTWVGTPTNTTLVDGDRILAVVEYVDGFPDDMAAGFQMQFRFGNTPAAFISTFTLTESITELASPIGVTHTLPQQGVGT